MYYQYSDYLKAKYGEKVYKLPININCTCPNRDGKISTKGCYFCSELGTGFESHHNSVPVKEQLLKNMEHIRKKYKAKKYIAYFQNYTNTYLPLEDFEKYMYEAVMDDIVEIVVSTRPDCIDENYLNILREIADKKKVNIGIELGLQSVNNRTLELINRGHNVQSYIDGVRLVKTYGFEVCTHLILNLPNDENEDVYRAAELMNELEMDLVKIHSLYISKGTVFETMYNNREFDIISKEQYIKRVAEFLGKLDANIAIQRVVARAPKEHTVFCNWDTSWWKIKDDILTYMTVHGITQGSLMK